ncbi:MAG TPA: hypothetical protein PLI26_08015, partial [Bacillota bacterium]|nr:hypothetical protein [Bacillota bacterium]
VRVGAGFVTRGWSLASHIRVRFSHPASGGGLRTLHQETVFTPCIRGWFVGLETEYEISFSILGARRGFAQMPLA